MSWITALGLCLAGFAAIIIEFFVPAAGIIGIVGLGSIVGGIVIAYREYGTLVGSIFLIGAVIATPGVIAAYFKLFPKSFVGKWLILRSGGSDDESRESAESDGAAAHEVEGAPPESGANDESNAAVAAPSGSGNSAGGGSSLGGLVGKHGTAVSMLRPAGTARIEGRRYSVVTGGEFVDPGSNVVVTRVQGNRIHVRSTGAPREAADQADAGAGQAGAGTPDAGQSEAGQADGAQPDAAQPDAGQPE